MKPYYVTNAITYPNAAPHLGHAYEFISSDVIARFKRLDGFDVRYLTGTDEHGLKMAQAAAAEGLPTAELARRNADVPEANQIVYRILGEGVHIAQLTPPLRDRGTTPIL